MPVVDGNIHTYIEGKSLVVAVALSNCLVLDRFVSFAVVNHHHHHHVVESKQCISKYHEFPHGALFYSVSLPDDTTVILRLRSVEMDFGGIPVFKHTHLT